MISKDRKKRLIEKELSSFHCEVFQNYTETGILPEENSYPMGRWKNLFEFTGGIIIGGCVAVLSIYFVAAFFLLFYK